MDAAAPTEPQGSAVSGLINAGFALGRVVLPASPEGARSGLALPGQAAAMQFLNADGWFLIHPSGEWVNLMQLTEDGSAVRHQILIPARRIHEIQIASVPAPEATA